MLAMIIMDFRHTNSIQNAVCMFFVLATIAVWYYSYSFSVGYERDLASMLNSPRCYLDDVTQEDGVLSVNLCVPISLSVTSGMVLGKNVADCRVVTKSIKLSENLIKALSANGVRVGAKPIAVAFADSMKQTQHARTACSTCGA